MRDYREKIALTPNEKCLGENSAAVKHFLAKVGDKWTLTVMLLLLKAKRARFSELRRDAEGISQAMLTSTLRGLEKDGLVTREVFPEVPPRVEYELTAMGLGLLQPMELLGNWIVANWPAVKKSREKFAAK